LLLGHHVHNRPDDAQSSDPRKRELRQRHGEVTEDMLRDLGFD
jgi:hypothetical protein